MSLDDFVSSTFSPPPTDKVSEWQLVLLIGNTNQPLVTMPGVNFFTPWPKITSSTLTESYKGNLADFHHLNFNVENFNDFAVNCVVADMICQELKFDIYTETTPNQDIVIVCMDGFEERVVEENYSIHKTWEIVKSFNNFETQLNRRFYSVVEKMIPKQWDSQILEPIKQVLGNGKTVGIVALKFFTPNLYYVYVPKKELKVLVIFSQI